MKVEQIYTNCIAEAAYYIESEGEAAIIDPLRETAPYLEKAAGDNARIKYIFETHFHADFVSGHIDLAKKSGGQIVYGPTAKPGFEAITAEDGQVFEIGKVRIKVLHTPGHTMESSTYLLIDEEGKHHAIFTGDTLFLGDVGRPDLAVKSDLTEEQLASFLYDSLRNRIMTLADNVIVYPGHGAGSACGKHMSKETVDTLGHQKMTNYALRSDMTREEFVKEITDGLLPPPQYFPKNAVMNKMGYESFDEVMSRGNNPLSIPEFRARMDAGALVLDVRSQNDFRKAHIPGAMFIGLDGSFAMWVGALIEDLKKEIILVVDKGREEEAVKRLSRVGYDHAAGYLNGGMSAWMEAGLPFEEVESVDASELESLLKTDHLNILDVRKPGEYEAEHIENAQHYPLDYINEHLTDLDKDKKYFVHCKGGYRSMAAISILKKAGYNNLVDVKGGMDAILKTGIKVTDFACQA